MTKPNNNHHRRPVADIVRELIKRRGLRQRDIEHRSGGRIEHGYLSKFLAEGTNPKLDKLIAFADTLDVSIAELADEESSVGFSRSTFYKLWEAYSRIAKDQHREAADRDIEELIGTINAYPKRGE